MPQTIASIPQLTVLDTDSAGLAVQAAFTSFSVFDTTAATYAPGCLAIDSSTGDQYYNSGTTALPVWTLLNEQKRVSVALSAANLIAMYTTAVQVVAAVPLRSIIVDSVDFDITRTSTQFTGGGVIAVQYDSTANGGGTATHATIAATVVTGTAGRTISARVPAVAGLSDVASASIVGKGLFISNQTAAFAAGTGTASLIVRYHLI